MRAPDFRVEVCGFAVPLAKGDHVRVNVSCGACGRRLDERVATLPGYPAIDLAAGLRAVLEHYRLVHLEVVERQERLPS